MSYKKSNNLIIGCLCAIGCEIFFGLSYIFTKQATDNASVLSLLCWRFLVAFIVMSICTFSGFIRINLKGKKIKPVLLIALFSPVIYYIGETIGISHTTASESGVFLACIPAVSLVASTLILNKKPSGRQVVGILVTLIGVLVTVLAIGATASLSAVGYLFLLIAVGSYALYSVFVEKASDYTGAEITYVMLTAGAIVFSILAIAEACVIGNVNVLMSLPARDSNFLIAILYQGIGCSVLAFFLSNVAIAKIGVNRTSSFIGVATVVSIIAGVILLGERFSIYQIIGAIIIIAGVYISNTNNIDD
ncbi:putative DMT superfamily transporter inner membrane protein [Clostridium acetireducens DSM 10703]|uniref:Putative DMT superfamily transporter inner membrane protein n=1 Tax=Clostridium acetireducens DSM 10703 TaxID=1121290 RepID=A0A1E8F0N1_9CLOT|nr:DMT family transporter [Clostridium acetireducens]OFI06696.1 putative DMT superfamily transporter inner membrane protein [Clostridium acetireducens DSM 10703]